MMSKLDDGSCEMNRLFVAPEFRGRGIGDALCATLFAAAREAGYLSMHLDTGPFRTKARALSAKLGFVECDAHYDPGPDWRDRMIFLKWSLVDPC